MARVKVLVVEDDPQLRSSLADGLSSRGHDALTAADGRSGMAAVTRDRPDVVVLDLSLPVLHGLEVCRRLRAAGDQVPILALTAHGSAEDRVAALDAGADAYLAKPVSADEVADRLGPLARRARPGAPTEPVLIVGDLRLHRGTHDVTRAGRLIPLTRTEFDLLAALMAQPGRVLGRAELISSVWGPTVDPGSNSLEVYVGYLRRKIEAGNQLRLIHTVRGAGYVIRPA